MSHFEWSLFFSDPAGHVLPFIVQTSSYLQQVLFYYLLFMWSFFEGSRVLGGCVPAGPLWGLDAQDG